MISEEIIILFLIELNKIEIIHTMELVLIILIAFVASFMTFMSGFGLGTLLLPAFALYFPIHIAIAMTAIVHLMNNIFKSFLMKKHVDWKVVLIFGIPSMLFAALGASILNILIDFDIQYTYKLLGYQMITTPINITIAGLMIIFALFDLVPKLREIKISKKALPIGGMLSGFFGGLSGHQGALRSTFLVKAEMPKEVYIATGIIIALMVDISRLFIYGFGRISIGVQDNWELLVVAVISAFVGAILGKYFLKKITIDFIRILIGTLLIVVSIGIGLGVI